MDLLPVVSGEERWRCCESDCRLVGSHEHARRLALQRKERSDYEPKGTVRDVEMMMEVGKAFITGSAPPHVS